MGTTHRKSYSLASTRVMEAEAGEEPALRRLLEVFSEIVRAGGTPDRPVLEYFAHAFERVLDGVCDEKKCELSIARPKSGRPPKSGLPRATNLNARRDRELARAVHDYLKGKNKLSIAYEDVAKIQGVSVSMVRRAWKRWGENVRTERQLRAHVRRLLIPLIEDQQTGSVIHPMAPEIRKAFRPIMNSLRGCLSDLDKAFRLWYAWQDGLITEEMGELGRRFAFEFCENFGTVSAIEWMDLSPECGWDKALHHPDFVEVLKILTSPPEGTNLALAQETELKDVWLRAFGNAQDILRLD